MTRSLRTVKKFVTTGRDRDFEGFHEAANVVNVSTSL
jgi:hypothetical protein